MIGAEQLEVCDNKLFHYDVVQRAWEHEVLGFERNAAHVLIHLSKDLVNKDFNDPQTAREATAPDALQYALRLARWTPLKVECLELDLTDENYQDLARVSERMGGNGQNLAITAFALATSRLASNLHDLDHVSKRQSAVDDRRMAVLETSKMLVCSAIISSVQHDFDLVEAFDERLSNLRLRSNIADPNI